MFGSRASIFGASRTGRGSSHYTVRNFMRCIRVGLTQAIRMTRCGPSTFARLVPHRAPLFTWDRPWDFDSKPLGFHETTRHSLVGEVTVLCRVVLSDVEGYQLGTAL